MHGTMCQPGSKGRKVILSSERENKMEMSSICLPVSFTPTRVPKKHVSHLYLTWVSPNYINVCIFKKNPTFKTITDFFRKAKIPATNIFKTHKQANAYPPCTAYPAAQNKGQSWTRFPFPQPPPYSTSNEQGQRPSLQSRFGAGELSPTLQQAPSSWLSRPLLTPAATSQKPLVFQ